MVTIFMNFLGVEGHYDDHCHDSAGLMKYYIQKGLFWQKNIFKFFFMAPYPVAIIGFVMALTMLLTALVDVIF